MKCSHDIIKINEKGTDDRGMTAKYNYKISFEKAKAFGIDENEYARESSKNCILTWIANELAEANRLKRLELKSSNKVIGKDTDGSFCYEFDDEELEDQAK